MICLIGSGQKMRLASLVSSTASGPSGAKSVGPPQLSPGFQTPRLPLQSRFSAAPARKYGGWTRCTTCYLPLTASTKSTRQCRRWRLASIAARAWTLDSRLRTSGLPREWLRTTDLFPCLSGIQQDTDTNAAAWQGTARQVMSIAERQDASMTRDML